jgi:hypothetical protein
MPKTEDGMEEQVSVRFKRRLLERIRHAAGVQGLAVAEFLRLAALRQVESVERKGN